MTFFVFLALFTASMVLGAEGHTFMALGLIGVAWWLSRPRKET